MAGLMTHVRVIASATLARVSFVATRVFFIATLLLRFCFCVAPERTNCPPAPKPRRRKPDECPEPALLFAEALEQEIETINQFLKFGKTLSRSPDEHLDLRNKIIMVPDALTNCNLRYACFRCAKLRRQKFGTADVAEADFRDADLTDADLFLVTGLVPAQLSGTDLTRCKLPDKIAAFPALANVTALSQNAGKIFLTALLASLYILLATITTKDIELLTNRGTAQLPVINFSVATAPFFGLASLVLLILFIVLHLYLQRLWETMASLPAVFPDGETVDDKTYPWLLNDLVWTGFPLLKRSGFARPLGGLQLITFSVLTYWGIPISLFIIFIRCLARHDGLLSGWHLAMLAAAITWSSVAANVNAMTLKRQDDRRAAFLARFGARFGLKQAAYLITTVGVGSCLIYLALCGTPLSLSEAQVSQARTSTSLDTTNDTLAKTISSISILREMNKIKITDITVDMFESELENMKLDRSKIENISRSFNKETPFALWRSPVLGHFRSDVLQPKFVSFVNSLPLPPPLSSANTVEDLSLQTDAWKPDTADYPSLPLPKIATMTEDQIKALAAKGKLDDSYYHVAPKQLADHEKDVEVWQEKIKSMVKPASFKDRNLRFLQGHGMFLVNADLRGADMIGCDFSGGTDFRTADFEDNSSPEPELAFASLSRAKLQGADLEGADLEDADLEGADLGDADLKGAHYESVFTPTWPHNLTQPPLRWRVRFEPAPSSPAERKKFPPDDPRARGIDIFVLERVEAGVHRAPRQAFDTYQRRKAVRGKEPPPGLPLAARGGVRVPSRTPPSEQGLEVGLRAGARAMKDLP